MLEYFQEQDAEGQYFERAKEKINDSLERCLRNEKKRFKLTLLMVGFFMVFFYGEFISLLKMAAFKKKSRSYIAYVYILMVGAIVVGGYLKRQAQLRNT